MHVLGIKSPAYLPVWFPPDVAAARGTPSWKPCIDSQFFDPGDRRPGSLRAAYAADTL
jgi:hypothetical protein